MSWEIPVIVIASIVVVAGGAFALIFYTGRQYQKSQQKRLSTLTTKWKLTEDEDYPQFAIWAFNLYLPSERQARKDIINADIRQRGGKLDTERELPEKEKKALAEEWLEKIEKWKKAGREPATPTSINLAAQLPLLGALRIAP